MPRSILTVYGPRGVQSVFAHGKWQNSLWATRKEVQTILEAALREGARTLEVHGPVLLLADRELAEQAMANMYHMILKCADQCAHDIMMSAFERPGCKIREIAVDDAKPGMNIRDLVQANASFEFVDLVTIHKNRRTGYTRGKSGRWVEHRPEPHFRCCAEPDYNNDFGPKGASFWPYTK